MPRTLALCTALARRLAPSAALVVGLVGLSGCASGAGDESSEAAPGELRTSPASPAAGPRTFTLDAAYTCKLQDMTTLQFTPAPSRGHVKIVLTFDGDPTVSSQVDAIVASRAPSEYRKHGKVQAGRVTVDVERDSIDGQQKKLSSHLVFDDLPGSVNADKEGSEAPYRLRYEVNGGLPTRPEPASPATDAYQEDFWFTLYNLGRAGKSFILASSSMLELEDGAKRLYCDARTTFADPVTGQTP